MIPDWSGPKPWRDSASAVSRPGDGVWTVGDARRASLGPIAALALLLSGCVGATKSGAAGSAGGEGGAGDPSHAGASSGGARGDGGDTSAGAGGDAPVGGGGFTAGHGPTAGRGGMGGGVGSAGSAGVAGAAGAAPDWASLVSSGVLDVDATPRPNWGGVLVTGDAERIIAVESRRLAEPGPLGMPWRTEFRLVGRHADGSTWTHRAERDAIISDVVLHPSGSATVAVQLFGPEEQAYRLLRFDPEGTLLASATMVPPPLPVEKPESDSAPPALRLAGPLADALSAGWLRLASTGESVVAAVLSFADFPESDPRRQSLVLAVEALEFTGGEFVARWARLVDDVHRADPAAWAYDELRWREQAVRPFLAVEPATGTIAVGRAWNRTRCDANVARFAEFTTQDCVLRSVDVVENERLPLAVTRFSPSGERLGTMVLGPDEDAVEQVPFDLVVEGNSFVVVGSVVRATESGERRRAEDGTFAYDGFLSVHDEHGGVVLQRDVDTGAGDVLSAVMSTRAGWVAVGSSGWRRGTGGMSISRGADPLVAFVDRDGGISSRLAPLTGGGRHFTLHDLTLDADSAGLHAVGFADAPMTHSGDGGNVEAMTFGGLAIRIAE